MSDVQHIKHFDMSDAVERATGKWLDIAGITVAAQAKELVPVKTGRLKGSITYEVKGKDCEIGTNVEYAPYIEYGTVRSPTGQPFLRPALRLKKKVLKDLWNKMLKEAQRA